jgi:hypothetical protein
MLLGVALLGFVLQARVRTRAEAIARRAEREDARVGLLSRHLASGFRELLGSRRREAAARPRCRNRSANTSA